MSDRPEDLYTWSKEDLIILIEALTLERDRLQKDLDLFKTAAEKAIMTAGGW